MPFQGFLSFLLRPFQGFLSFFPKAFCVGSFKHQFDSSIFNSITLIALIARRDHCDCEFSYKSLPAWFHIVFSQTSDHIESNISALPVKKQYFPLIFEQNSYRLQTPALHEDFIVCFAIRVFAFSGFAWSLGKKTSTRQFGASFFVKLSQIHYQTCREYRTILSSFT